MEFILGSIFSVLLITFLSSRASKKNDTRKISIKYSQSYKHELVKFSYVYEVKEKINTNRQSFKHYDANSTRVVIFEDKAYWIKDSHLHSADFFDGLISEETTKRVDTMILDDVELKKIVFIIDKLNEEV